MLELIFQGFLEWTYGLILECWEYFSSVLFDLMSLDFAYGIICADRQTLAIHTVELLPVEAYTAHYGAAVAPSLGRILDAANAGEKLCRVGDVCLLTGKPRQLRIIPQRVSGKLRAFVGTGHGDLRG